MSRTLRWILYVLLGLVVLALIAGVIFSIFGGFGGYSMMGPYGGWMWNHMRGGNFPLLTVFGGLLCLGFFLLVVIGIVALVAALTRRNPVVPTTPPVSTPPAVVAERPCPNCGRMTQEDWKTCPYCGNPLP